MSDMSDTGSHHLFLGPIYLLHLVFITVHDADAEHQLFCIIIIKDAIQIIAKTWWGGAMRKITSIGLASRSLVTCNTPPPPQTHTEPFWRKGGETLRRKRERKGKLEKRCLGGAVPVNERW